MPTVSQEIVFDAGDPLLSILALVAKYHSIEEKATPRRIAADLRLDPNVTLTHMRNYNNDQFVTFYNKGNPPELDTPFFLSSKAWERIKIVRA